MRKVSASPKVRVKHGGRSLESRWETGEHDQMKSVEALTPKELGIQRYRRARALALLTG